MRRVLGVAALLLFHFLSGYGQSGEITGQVIDEETKEGVPFANVAVLQGGNIVLGAATGFDGSYVLKPLDPGTYVVQVSVVGYQTQNISNVTVTANKITTLNVNVRAGIEVQTVEVVFERPLIDKDNPGSVNFISTDEIESAPYTDVASLVSTTAGVYQSDEGGELNFRGARSDANVTYIDGVKLIPRATEDKSTGVSVSEIEELSVYTAAVPAKFGDAIGGVMVINTMNPSNKFGGSIDISTSKGMDHYGYTRGNFNITGPIIKKNKGTKEEKSILGYFLNAEYVREDDSRPLIDGVYVAKDDTLEYLEQNPLVPSPVSEAFIVTTETVTKEGLEKVYTKPNVANNNYYISGKLELKPSNTTSLIVGASYNLNRGHDWVDRYTMFNYVNNPFIKQNTYRTYARFKQRFISAAPSDDAAEENGAGRKKNVFQNAFYTIQFDYSKHKDITEDDSHGESAFDYGYLGSFDILRQPIFEHDVDEKSGKFGWKQVGYQDTLVRFAPSDVNPTGTAFPEAYYQLAGAEFRDGWWTAPSAGAQAGYYQTLDQILINNGMINGSRPRVPHDIWFNTGRQFNGHSFQDNDQFRIGLNTSVDIMPGGTARNKHAIEFGLEFEQRIERGYSLQSIELWTLMRQLANSHLDQLDTDNPYLLIEGELYRYDDPNAPAFGENDTIVYQRRYDGTQQRFFDKQLRKKLGLSENSLEYINTDLQTPDFYSLDMFSADELWNSGNSYVSYYGYDYLGNKLSSQPSFNDFFTEKDENGNYTRPIGAFRPIYASAYIQDKFNFRDLLFNIGLRVDRYDANQKVLRDKYVLYDSYTVGEARDLLDNTPIPANIGDDYVVYIDDLSKENPSPVGFRDGDTWYNIDGDEINSAQLLATSSTTGQITPYLVDPNITFKSSNFDPETSFEDYDPQISLMPRIAFSFNLTDEASFFAHYDILSQRPPNFIRTPPSSWYYFEDNVGGFINNPNLRAQKAIDYQVGFRQLLTRNSAVSLTAFYRELKDLIQVQSVSFAYPNDYLTFGNIDFSTVKGFTVGYDLRRSKDPISNIGLRANYTIQFAEGTGSNSTSAVNLVRAGQPNLRTITPLNYDSRHMLNLIIDYAFDEGEFYNGPKIKGKDILSNFGVNLTVRARSGEPFTRQQNPTADALSGQASRRILTGGINSARLPWNFKIDFEVYKDFNLTGNRERTDSEGNPISPRRDLTLSIYFTVKNLLNTRNVLAVYPFTGSPDDDGYLASPIGQQDLESRINAASFADMYSAYLEMGYNNGIYNYNAPRSIRVGAKFFF